MITKHSTDFAALKAEFTVQIAEQLSFNPKKLPISVGQTQASEILSVKESTLAVWRSTGRYNLPYIKVGRLVKYRISDLAEFLARRTAHHTGEIS